MKYLILIMLALFTTTVAFSQSEKQAANSGVFGHDYTFSAKGTASGFSGVGPTYAGGLLTSGTNLTGVPAFANLSSAAVGDIFFCSNNGIYEIIVTDGATDPTVTLELLNDPLLLGTTIVPSGEGVIARPTGVFGLIPQYLADAGVGNGTTFKLPMMISIYNTNRLESALGSLNDIDTVSTTQIGNVVAPTAGEAYIRYNSLDAEVTKWNPITVMWELISGLPTAIGTEILLSESTVFGDSLQTAFDVAAKIAQWEYVTEVAHGYSVGDILFFNDTGSGLANNTTLTQGQMVIQEVVDVDHYYICNACAVPTTFAPAYPNGTNLYWNGTALDSISTASNQYAGFYLGGKAHVTLAGSGATSSGSGGSGTVTSVGLTMPTGFAVTGSPITGTGTFSVTTALNGLLQGNGTGITALSLGTANQEIRVNAGGTALEYYTPTTSVNIMTGSSTMVANQTQSLAGFTNTWNSAGASPLMTWNGTNGRVYVGSTASTNVGFFSAVAANNGVGENIRFGGLADATHSLTMERGGVVRGGLTLRNGVIGLFGGAAPNDHLSISNTGFVGLNDVTPTRRLTVSQASAPQLRLQASDVGLGIYTEFEMIGTGVDYLRIIADNLNTTPIWNGGDRTIADNTDDSATNVDDCDGIMFMSDTVNDSNFSDFSPSANFHIDKAIIIIKPSATTLFGDIDDGVRFVPTGGATVSGATSYLFTTSQAVRFRYNEGTTDWLILN